MSSEKDRWVCVELAYEDDMPRDGPAFDDSANAGFLVPVEVGEHTISYEDVLERGHFYRTDAELLWHLSHTVPQGAEIGEPGIELGPSCERVLRLRTASVYNLGVEPEDPNRAVGVGKGWRVYKLAGQTSTTAGVVFFELNWTGSISVGYRYCYFFRDETEALQLLDASPFKGKSTDRGLYVWRTETPDWGDERSCLAPFSTEEVVFLGDLEPDEE
jgi:hypothetical protein